MFMFMFICSCSLCPKKWTRSDFHVHVHVSIPTVRSLRWNLNRKWVRRKEPSLLVGSIFERKIDLDRSWSCEFCTLSYARSLCWKVRPIPKSWNKNLRSWGTLFEKNHDFKSWFQFWENSFRPTNFFSQRIFPIFFLNGFFFLGSELYQHQKPAHKM